MLWTACTCACGKSFPKIVPMAKLDSLGELVWIWLFCPLTCKIEFMIIFTINSLSVFNFSAIIWALYLCLLHILKFVWFTYSFFRCTNDSSVAKIKIHQISDGDHITELGIFCRIPENVNEQSFAPKVVPKSPIEEDIAANFEQKLRFDLHKWDGSSLEFRYKQERRQLTEI